MSLLIFCLILGQRHFSDNSVLRHNAPPTISSILGVFLKSPTLHGGCSTSPTKPTSPTTHFFDSSLLRQKIYAHFSDKKIYAHFSDKKRYAHFSDKNIYAHFSDKNICPLLQQMNICPFLRQKYMPTSPTKNICPLLRQKIYAHFSDKKYIPTSPTNLSCFFHRHFTPAYLRQFDCLYL